MFSGFDPEAVEARSAFETLMQGLAAKRWKDVGPTTVESQRKRLVKALAECAPMQKVSASASPEHRGPRSQPYAKLAPQRRELGRRVSLRVLGLARQDARGGNDGKQRGRLGPLAPGWVIDGVRDRRQKWSRYAAALPKGAGCSQVVMSGDAAADGVDGCLDAVLEVELGELARSSGNSTDSAPDA